MNDVLLFAYNKLHISCVALGKQVMSLTRLQGEL